LKKIRIVVKISRYQEDKMLGELYRADPDATGVSFTVWKRKYKDEQKQKLFLYSHIDLWKSVKIINNQ